MIKFFRHIRKKLLSENRFNKYLLYAIGEIILVVIGILIALQINNWNEYDKSQALAQKYLKLIKSDLELDIKHFETLSKGLTQQAMKIDSIENILSRPQTKQEEFKEIIRNNSTVFAVIEDTNLNTSTFSALQNSGRIDLLDKDLQDGLRKLNQEQYRYKEYTNDNIDAMLKEFSNYIQEIPAFVQFLWQQPERELQYFGNDINEKYVTKFPESYLSHIEYCITHKSWWDTVDTLAIRVVGEFFKVYPDLREATTEGWINSDNFWLQRVAIIHQLKYKESTNTEMLFAYCEQMKESQEFFIQKAIGWALREYSKTDATAVVNFVLNTDLAKFSKKEALKWLKNKEKL